MQKQRHLILAIILCAAIIISFAFPRHKYKSQDLLSGLDIPYKMVGWQGLNIAGELDLNDLRYNFISRVFARLYTNAYSKQGLIWLILDAGNFHDPKVCFESGGFKTVDLPDLRLEAAGRSFKARALYFEKGSEGYVVIYWMCIDKRMVDWKRQKATQLFYSLFNKEKTGLMVRLDIPAATETIDNAVNLAKEFISDVSPKIPEAKKEYIFGN